MQNVPLGVARRVVLKAYLTADHISPGTGLTVAVTISKNGAGFGNPSAGATNATEIGNGWYYVDLSATDTGTAGPLVVRGTEGTIDPAERDFHVEARYYGVRKNVALAGFPFVMFDAAGTPATGLTVTAERMLDGGAFAACANAVVEDTAGWYHIDLAASDLNADTVALKFTAGGARAANYTVLTVLP